MAQDEAADSLRRSLSLWQVVLYGLGVTIGAGIYVLVGVAAGRSGPHAPLAFILAAALLSFTGATLAELGARLPVSASEAAYVEAAFSRKWLTLAVGLTVIGAASISAATVSVGAAGYVAVFLNSPAPLLIVLVVISMGLIASLTTEQSVTVAGLMTIVEIGGLIAFLVAGGLHPDLLTAALPRVLPGFSMAAWTGILGTSLVAVFAFIGFEHVVNIAEEVRNPKKLLPLAILLTLGLTTILYTAVVFVAIAAVPPLELESSSAPLALAHERLTGRPPVAMSAVAIVATLNGIVVHIIMISRVLYGLSRAGDLPAALGCVHPRTRTPLRATFVAVIAILTLSLMFPIDQLARFTAQATLVIFIAVNAALVRIKMRETTPPEGIFVAPAWVPYAGILANLLLLTASMSPG